MLETDAQGYFSDLSALGKLDDPDMREVKNFLLCSFTPTVAAMICSFNGFRHVGSTEQAKNLLTWYDLESVAQELTA